ncbi:hypothetical protein [Desulfospira joergensenii]|uniref:hypothetical protein n=1 Tax=Desulfospira joergensenii TaxID=53329 RepID=UPI0003B3096F|nr:hypothetical protein [Desulfospira joergensenii]
METREKYIQGIIIPVEWDNDGLVLRTGITTFDEDLLVITDNDFGRILNQRLRETVTLLGRVSVHGGVKQVDVLQILAG